MKAGAMGNAVDGVQDRRRLMAQTMGEKNAFISGEGSQDAASFESKYECRRLRRQAEVKLRWFHNSSTREEAVWECMGGCVEESAPKGGGAARWYLRGLCFGGALSFLMNLNYSSRLKVPCSDL